VNREIGSILRITLRELRFIKAIPYSCANHTNPILSHKRFHQPESPFYKARRARLLLYGKKAKEKQK